MKNTKGRRQKAEYEGQKAEGGVAKRAPARTFQELIVWQKSHALVLKIYKHSKNFPITRFLVLLSSFVGLQFQFLPTLLKASKNVGSLTRHVSSTLHKVPWKKHVTT